VSNRSPVIVPVDGSPRIERTVEFAVNIARQRAADVHAVQVVPRDGGLWRAPEDETRLRARVRGMQRSAENAGVRVRIVTLRGTPHTAIPAYAQLTRASMIVIGRHYGSSRFWRHSAIASRLIRSSPVPVVVIPGRGETLAAPPLNRIVAAVDFTVASAIALQTAVDLSKRHGARLTLVHAMDPLRRMVFSGGEASRLVHRLPAEAKAVAGRLRNKAMALGFGNAEPVVVTGDPDRGIVLTAQERAADLIVMGVAPRHWLDRTVFGSTLRAVLRRTETPILILSVIGGEHPWIDTTGREEESERRGFRDWPRPDSTAHPDVGYMLT
jgi:nucleotide-binding universal stress UspA family protein